MTTQQDEHFSALIDGELDDSNAEIILNKLSQNDSDKQRWHRYHIISDALQSKLPDYINPSFSHSVMAAIESEPAILAIQHKHHMSMGKRIVGTALAASVAMIAVFAVKTNMQEEPVPQLAQMPSSDQFVRLAQEPKLTPLRSALPAMTVSSSSTSQSTQASETPIVKIDPQLQLHQYIMNHSQRVSGGQLQGIMPYARLVVVPAPTQSQQGAGQK